MSMPRLVFAGAMLATVMLGTSPRADPAAPAPRLGTPMSKDEVAKWDRTIFPDGHGLPPGRGTAKEGRALYAHSCAVCHGKNGEGATAEELIGGSWPPVGEGASKSIGSYWPFATTIFDFISRSMPPAAPGSLSADETYALTAYLLSANKIIAETDEMNPQTLPGVRMPNRDGFVWIDVRK